MSLTPNFNLIPDLGTNFANFVGGGFSKSNAGQCMEFSPCILWGTGRVNNDVLATELG